jgi:UDP-glucuronate 4-epimerase
MTDRVLVTGAAGFIGSHLCEALLSRGDRVVGIDNFDPYYDPAVKEANLAALHARAGFHFERLDIVTDDLPFDGVTAVVHLAARPGVQPSLVDPASYMQTNITGTVRVIEAARRAGVWRMVLASSSSVYGETTPAPFAESAAAVQPISPYAASKRAGELVAYALARLHGLRIACLRFFTVYGPRQRPDLAIHRFTARIRQGLPIQMNGDGSSERDYTYISDAVEGILGALAWTATAGAGTCDPFNIGGGERVRLDRLIRLLGEALGRPPVVERRPDQPGDVPLTAADLRRATSTLGYRPRVGIADGIRAFVRWYEATHGSES